MFSVDTYVHRLPPLYPTVTSYNVYKTPPFTLSHCCMYCFVLVYTLYPGTHYSTLLDLLLSAYIPTCYYWAVLVVMRRGSVHYFVLHNWICYTYTTLYTAPYTTHTTHILHCTLYTLYTRLTRCSCTPENSTVAIDHQTCYCLFSVFWCYSLSILRLHCHCLLRGCPGG